MGTFKRFMNSCLLRLGQRLPTRDEMATFFQEAVAIMNNSLLYPVTADPNDEFPITPAMLLTGKVCPNPPPPELFSEKDHLADGAESRCWLTISSKDGEQKTSARSPSARNGYITREM